MGRIIYDLNLATPTIEIDHGQIWYKDNFSEFTRAYVSYARVDMKELFDMVSL